MHKALLAILVVIAILIPVLLTNRSETPPPPTNPPANPPVVDSRPTPPKPNAFPSTVTTLAIAESAKMLNSADTTIEDDFSHLELLLSQYRKHLGTGNPVGDNAEITAALLGRNTKGIAYLPSSGPFMDSQGRLLDRWGTPYFFHAITGEHMQIHSAGPDRKLHTDDDVVSEF